MKNLLLIIFFILTISNVKAETKYFCNGETNQFFIKFNKKKKTISIDNRNPNKYWTETDYIFWQTANDLTVYEYTFKNSYNKLSGVLQVKSHHLVTSENKWYNYDCSISE